MPPITPPPFGIHNRWPVYTFTQYLHRERYDVHVLGTPGVSEWMMRASGGLIDRMIDALKHPEDRAKFAGHRCMLVTDDDPAIPGSAPGHRNTGGDGFSMFNEELVCATAVDTIRPNAKPVFRAWYTPVHEFTHAIEFTLGLQARSDAVYRKHIANYNPKVAREYFCWSVQKWFDSLDNDDQRGDMPRWEYDYIASIFDADNHWKPGDTRPPRPKADPEHFPKPVEVTRAHLEALVGTYERRPVENDWHRGRITIDRRDGAGNPTALRWTNAAGRSWVLTPQPPGRALHTGPDNPYHERQKGAPYLIGFDRSDPAAGPTPAGVWFVSSLYIKQPPQP